MKSLINKLIKITLGLLGVAMVDSCVAKAEYPNPNYVGGPITDTLWTSHAGEYVSRDDNFANLGSEKLEFEDVDGAENGGEFQSVTVEVPIFKVREGDGNWYMGAYEAGADVTMLKK